MRPAVDAAAQRLRIDYATAEVLRGFDVAGVQCVLLKGASVFRWLYDQEEARSYLDCDLLVRPDDIEAAAGVLRGLGFEPEVDEQHMPDWWVEHGLGWYRRRDRAAVDLHRTLPGLEADAARVWDVLSAATEAIVVGGFPAQTLAVPGRALHVALHTAQHRGSKRRVAELERAVRRADQEVWRDAAELAAALGGAALFAAGLRLSEGGAALADRLGLESARPTDAILRTEAPAQALTIDRLVRTEGFGARLGIVRHKLAPPPTFMRKWSPLARRGRLGLAAAYFWRPIWVLGGTPRALRAWRGARRAARREAGTGEPS